MFTKDQKVVVMVPNHPKYVEVGSVAVIGGEGSTLAQGTLSVVFSDGVRYRFFKSELVPLTDRLESLRADLRAENISMGGLIELQGYAAHIEPGDVELLEPAGVPEFPEEDYTGRRVEWTDPDGGGVHTGRVSSHNPDDDSFQLLMDDGGETGAFGHELHFV